MNYTDDIERRVDAAFADMRTVAADDRYSDEYKRERIASIASTATATIDMTFVVDDEQVQQHRADLASKLYVSPAPTAAEAPALNYLRDALAVQWEYMDRSEIDAQWQQAIDRGDAATARVYRDFLPMHVARQAPAVSTALDGARRAMDIPLAERLKNIRSAYEGMTTATNTLLMTPEHRTAQGVLEQYNADIAATKRALSGARSRLSGVRILPDGTIQDGIQSGMACRVRSTF
ncbi:MAG: hypothetical protein AAF653_08340 [Chloroflexota bacterium]